jgi:hypothetical protein
VKRNLLPQKTVKRKKSKASLLSSPKHENFYQNYQQSDEDSVREFGYGRKPFYDLPVSGRDRG